MRAKHIKMSVLILFTCVAFLSCTKEGNDISDNDFRIYEFHELPVEVKKILDMKISEVSNSENKLYYSTNDKIKFKYFRKNISRNWLKETYNNDEYFLIESEIYRIKGNKGGPFILHENKFYYCDYNIDMDNYKKQKYYSVSIIDN
jgi:hypothetical protein